MKHISRRNFLKFVGVSLLAADAWSHGESRFLVLTKHSLKVGCARPIKLLHLSDLHVASQGDLSLVSEAVTLGLSQNPDLICLSGDYVNSGSCEIQDSSYARVLSRLSKAAPTYACLGNNDGALVVKTQLWHDTSRVEALLADAKICILKNDTAVFSGNGAVLQIVGLQDQYSGSFDAKRAFAKIGKNTENPIVAICHNPDRRLELKAFPWALLLCGHTHGGQVSIPFIGPPILPVKDRSMIAGAYVYDNRQIYITRGVGNWYGVRFNCPPEVTVVTLT
jgi:predicted MPP superfamily phosphohydrolase